VWILTLVGGLALWLMPGAADAAPVPVYIQPIIVCDAGGVGCAQNPLTSDGAADRFEQIAIEAMKQLNVDLRFLAPNTFSDSGGTTFNNIVCGGGFTDSCPEAVSLITGAGHGQFVAPNLPSITPIDPNDNLIDDTPVFNMWFVEDIDDSWGRAATPGNGVIIDANGIIAADRFDTLAHEISHNFGFIHPTDDSVPPVATLPLTEYQKSLMAIDLNCSTGFCRTIPQTTADVAPNGQDLSFIEGDAPAVTVDTIGDTPFQNPSFFNVTFNQGRPDVSLTTLTLNVAPVGAFFDPTILPPGAGPTPFDAINFINTINFVDNETDQTKILTRSDIQVIGDVDGGTLLTLLLPTGKFDEGDSFSFSIDIDLFSNIDGFGATPAELQGSIFNFGFSHGFGFQGVLADNVVSTVFDPRKSALLQVTPFSIGTQDIVPLPGTLVLTGLGAIGLAIWRRRRPG
jgi:hypothetical protein